MRKLATKIITASLVVAGLSVVGAVQTPVSAQEFTNLYVFGDSLSDPGAYTQSIVAGGAPNSTRYRFTNNALDGSALTYAEQLAVLLGIPNEPSFLPGVPAANVPDINTGGTNFAQGGSRVSQQPGIGNNAPFGITTIPVSEQVDNFLASGRGLGSNDLIILWAGANDVFAQAGAVNLGLPAGTALANMQTAANDLGDQVRRLKAAGAENIIVITVPDIGGNTPQGTAAGPAGAGLFTALTDAFNTQLTTTLSGTNAAISDSNRLLTAVLDNPALYGFDAINQRAAVACTTASSLTCIDGLTTNAGSFVFADGVHPTLRRMHCLLRLLLQAFKQQHKMRL